MPLEKLSSWTTIREVHRINFVGQVFRVLAVLASNILIVRVLDHGEYRDYSWIGALCIFIQTLLTLGFDQSFSYYFPRFLHEGKPEKIVALTRAAFRWVMAFSVVSILLILLSGYFFLNVSAEPELFSLFVVCSLGNVLFAFSQLPLGALRALGRFAPAIWIEQFLLTGLPLLFVSGVALFGANALQIFSAQAFAFFLVLVVGVMRLIPALKEVPKSKTAPAGTHRPSWSWMLYSVPISVMLTLEAMFTWMTLAVAGKTIGDFETSFVGIALRSIQFFTFLSMAIAPLLMPKISHHSHRKDQAEMSDVISKMTLWMGCWALLICFGIAVNRHLVLLPFGQEFALASTAILWLLPGALAEGTFGFLKHASLSVGQNISGIVIYTLGIFCAAVLAHTLGLRYSIAGVLAAASIAMILVNLLRALHFQRKNGIGIVTGKGILKILVTAAALLIIGLFLEQSFSQDAIWERLIISVFASGLVILLLLKKELLLLLNPDQN